MNVASRILSEELFKISGWGKTPWLYFKSPSRATDWSLITGEGYWEAVKSHSGLELNTLPAYDAGFMLRKLPLITHHGGLAFGHVKDGTWYFNLTLTGIRADGRQSSFSSEADTLENALAKLSIELFKQGVLTQEGVNRE